MKIFSPTQLERSKIMPMQMQVEYPETLPDALAETRQEFENEAKLAMAAKLYEMKRLSSGQAAQMLGINRVEFLLALHKVGTPAIHLTEEELLSDIGNANQTRPTRQGV